jgi:hypothetical protein
MEQLLARRKIKDLTKDNYPLYPVDRKRKEFVFFSDGIYWGRCCLRKRTKKIKKYFQHLRGLKIVVFFASHYKYVGSSIS